MLWLVSNFCINLFSLYIFFHVDVLIFKLSVDFLEIPSIMGSERGRAIILSTLEAAFSLWRVLCTVMNEIIVDSEFYVYCTLHSLILF